MSRGVALALVVFATGCDLFAGDFRIDLDPDDCGPYPDTAGSCTCDYGTWHCDTCGGEPQPEDTCTPGDTCSYESWEHGCSCACGEDGHWACSNETIGSHCTTGEYGAFSDPSRLDQVTTPLDERAPAIAADGSELVFARPGPGGDLDLWRAPAAASGGFDPAVRDGQLSSAADDTDPSLSADGLTVYFARGGNTLQATGGGAAIVAVPELAGFTGADFSRPADTALVAAANGAVIEFTRPDAATSWTQVGTVDQAGAAPCLRDDGHELIFEGVRDGKRALFQALRSQRDLSWQVVIPIFISGMDGANVGDPELSADGLALYFTSDVGGNYDIYVMTRYRM